MRQPVWQRAAAFAARMHTHDTRDDEETPYFSHPARVAMTVSCIFEHGDDATIAAAYLHDVMENTDEGYDQLAEEFGAEIADMVVALTKNMMLPREERDEEYMQRLSKADWRARLVKLADQYDNMCDAMTGMKEDPQDERKKCKKILRLARADAKEHPETRRAIAALEKLLGAPRLKR
jgi:(p)ppGpp synthase/HD superfamily hydrolase